MSPIKQSGLTLIEALISMLLLSIGVLALISLITSVTLASHRADSGALMRILATDLQERAWIHSTPGTTCNDSQGMANLSNWTDHPMHDVESMPPVILEVGGSAGCFLTIKPLGSLPKATYQITGPGGDESP